MGRTAAVIWHALFSIVAAGLYFFFVLPRWPELMGQTSPTLGLVLRIVTGVLIGLTALPVVFTLQRTQRPEFRTPQLALRLRTWSIVLHVLAGVLIIGTAVSEIWLSLDDAGQWLFGIYGAAAAIALLAIFGFYLAFVAELPPPPPKPLKSREKTKRGRRKVKTGDDETIAETTSDATDDEAEEAQDEAPAEVEATEQPTETEAESEPATEAESETEPAAEPEADEPESSVEETEAAEEAEDTAKRDKLRNRRPSNKGGSSRLRRRSRGGIALED